MTPREYFRLLAPEFASLTDVQVDGLITVAQLFVYAPCLDQERLNAATAMYAAHLAYLQAQSANGNTSGAGPITSEKEGDLSRSYGNGSASSSTTLLGQDRYGQMYLDATAACFGATIMTRYGDTVPQGVEVVPSGIIY